MYSFWDFSALWNLRSTVSLDITQSVLKINENEKIPTFFLNVDFRLWGKLRDIPRTNCSVFFMVFRALCIILGTLVYAGKLAVKQEQKFAHGTEVRFDCVEGQKRSWKIVCFNGRWVGLSLGCDENGQPQGGSQVKILFLKIIINWHSQ